MDNAAKDFASLMPFGTPAEVLEKLKFMQETIDNNGILGNFSYAGMPFDEAERNIKCFAKHVMPELKKWKTAPLPGRRNSSCSRSRPAPPSPHLCVLPPSPIVLGEEVEKEMWSRARKRRLFFSAALARRNLAMHAPITRAKKGGSHRQFRTAWTPTL